MADSIVLKTVTVEDPINISDLTDTTVGGVGVFDKLLTTMKAHLDIEYSKGRITGTDYANVYLASYQATLQQSSSFLLEKEKQAYELAKLDSDRDLVIAQIAKINEETLLVRVQTQNAELEASKITQEIQQLGATIGYTEAQTAMLTTQTVYEEFKNAYIQPKELEQITEQVANLISQGDQIEKQTLGIQAETSIKSYQLANLLPAELASTTAKTSQITQQTTNLVAEALNIPKQGSLIDSQTDLTTEQTATVVYDRTVRAPVELANLAKQGDILTQQILVQQSEVLLKEKEIELSTAQLAIDVKQLDVLIASIAAQQAQADLYTQKIVTEKAQVDNTVVGADSSIDQQNKLLLAQREGYARDAEQKTAKLMIDTWNVRKNADSDAVSADFVNLLDDKNVGIAVDKMFDGIGLTAATS